MKRTSTFAQRLAMIRREKDITLETMAQAIGYPAQTINRWERGERVPKIDIASSIAEKLGVSPLWLIGYDVTQSDGADTGAVALTAQRHEIPPEYFCLSAANRETVDILIRHLADAQDEKLSAVAADCVQITEKAGADFMQRPAKELKK